MSGCEYQEHICGIRCKSPHYCFCPFDSGFFQNLLVSGISDDIMDFILFQDIFEFFILFYDDNVLCIFGHEFAQHSADATVTADNVMIFHFFYFVVQTLPPQ